MLELNGPVVVELDLGIAGGSDCKPLSAVQWEKIIGKLDVYVQEYRISGHRAIENPDFFNITAVLEKTGKFYHIFTDGLWEDTDRVLDGFVKCAHINTLNFSLNGSSFKVHQAHCQDFTEEKYEKLLDNIRLSFSAGHNVNTVTVLTKMNIESIEEITELSTDLGANFAIFTRYLGPADEKLDLEPEELKEAGFAVEKLKSLGYNVVLGNGIPFCHIPSQTAGCFEGITLGAVDPCGNLKPGVGSTLVAGNLLKGEVTPLWRSSAMRKWREKVPSMCKKCSKVSVCGGGNRIFAETRGISADPLIGEPLVRPDQPRVLDVTLEEDLFPLARYVMRQEDFGWILIRGNQVIPVRRRAEAILKSMDGTSMTLGQIKKRFGPGALSFIYSLYVRDFIEFRTRTEEDKTD